MSSKINISRMKTDLTIAKKKKRQNSPCLQIIGEKAYLDRGRKFLDSIQDPFILKEITKLIFFGKGNFMDLIKHIYEGSTAYVILKGNIKNFPFRTWNLAMMSNFINSI